MSWLMLQSTISPCWDPARAHSLSLGWFVLKRITIVAFDNFITAVKSINQFIQNCKYRVGANNLLVRKPGPVQWTYLCFFGNHSTARYSCTILQLQCARYIYVGACMIDVVQLSTQHRLSLTTTGLFMACQLFSHPACNNKDGNCQAFVVFLIKRPSKAKTLTT